MNGKAKMTPLTTASVLREVSSALDQIQAKEQTADEVVASFAPKKKPEEEQGLPDYVEHDEATPHIGRLASEAVIKSWELAAQDLEQMGAQFQKRSDDVQRTVLHTAALIRKRGIDCFNSIEVAVTMADTVSRECAEIRARLALKDITGA